MKRFPFYVLIFAINFCSAQVKLSQESKIKSRVVNFLAWHKKGGENIPGPAYFVPRYDELDSAKTYFDIDSLERYYNIFRKSKFVSEQYINQLKDYFNYYGKFIGPKRKPNEIIKIDGLDQDIILNTFEPELILDNLTRVTITKSLIIYNKALIGMNFTKGVDMIFILTKQNDDWEIDYIGPNNSSTQSLFRQ